MTTTLDLLTNAVGNVNGPVFTYSFANPVNGTVTITVTGSFFSLEIQTSTFLEPNYDANPPLTVNASGTYTFSAVNMVGIRAFLIGGSDGSPVSVTASF